MPLDVGLYDRDPVLSPGEWDALERVERHSKGEWPPDLYGALGRLLRPIRDVLELSGVINDVRIDVRRFLAIEMRRIGTAFWGWTLDDWGDVLGRCLLHHRPHVLLVGYQLCGFYRLHDLVGTYLQYPFAARAFGREAVDAAVGRLHRVLTGWGYKDCEPNRAQLRRATCELLLWNRSPLLEDLTPEVLDEVLAEPRLVVHRPILLRMSRALLHLGIIDRPPLVAVPLVGLMRNPHSSSPGVPQEWADWCRRWHRTSTLSQKARYQHYRRLLKVGRWLGETHPHVASPEQWTRELAAEYVAVVNGLRVGQWGEGDRQGEGKELGAHTKRGYLGTVRRFLADCQEWGWIPRRFDPYRALATPRSIRALIGPDPRVISDDVWAKLLWAGLNLQPEDLNRVSADECGRNGYPWYPIEMVRALAMVWLFAGLRADEIRRLRVGCVRWQREDVAVPGMGEELARDAVCLLDVPTNKTATAFTKPVDRVVGEAVGAWEGVRPDSPREVDAKTGEVVSFLFSYRGLRLGDRYINASLVSTLCRKAGIPPGDARGGITSHRARSTIASQLFNAKEPMSLFELQEWLGHKSPRSTQHYAKITPTKLAKSYADAGYFGRNVRLIEVLVDHEAVRNGAAATGQPYLYYDLGHGYCTYDFYAQCPHRMACARCSFYVPKGSSSAQLLEGKANLARLREEIPLTDEEAAAVDEGISLHERLLEKLSDIPTPDGTKPRAFDGAEPTVQSRRS